jgi:hypothetical protein
MQAPSIDFRQLTADTERLCAERDKDVRIVELLNANSALVEEKRQLKRRLNSVVVHAFQFGMVFGICCTVVAIAAVAAIFRFWLFK